MGIFPTVVPGMTPLGLSVGAGGYVLIIRAGVIVGVGFASYPVVARIGVTGLRRCQFAT